MGQIASAAGNPNTFAPDPSGFSGSEWATRIGGGAMKGLGNGLQNYQQQNAAQRQQPGAQMQSQPASQPQIAWPTLGQNRNMLPKGNNVAFYGDSGG